jgi:hypothetical protein
VLDFAVPTMKVRHHVTETDDIAAALDLASRRWPHESRSNLARRLILEGAARLAESPIERALGIEEALRDLAALEDCYPEGYLAGIREDWERLRQ